VLIRGESGVGKELVARAIHQRSTRRSRPFVKVNCAALPAELLESELFGHEKGAFTGAAMMRIGKFEQADGGTLMLDEIGEMSPALQAKLLHVLQDGEFTRLGSNKRVEVDVRVVAATNRDLETMMLSGGFREDLYYRLRVIEVFVPSLRERRDEIPALIDCFVSRYSRKYNRPTPSMGPKLKQMFMEYAWPGNIRELENMIKRIVILQDEELVVREIVRNSQRVAASAAASAVVAAQAGAAAVVAAPVAVATLPGPESFGRLGEPEDADDSQAAGAAETNGSLAALAKAAAMKAERAAISETLTQVHWNRRKAAQILGVSYKTLLNKIKECGITRAS
jgi:transcriptional regulator with GAF, ATPase, and Fis domain